MIENEGYKNRIIAVEVAFKGAIELAKEGKIKVEDIYKNTEESFRMILSLADAKVDDDKIMYLHQLLGNSTYDHDRQEEMLKDYRFGNMNYEQYYRIKEDLLMNQLDIIKESGDLHSRKNINKQIDKDMANDKA